jgi:hypothetical protein
MWIGQANWQGAILPSSGQHSSPWMREGRDDLLLSGSELTVALLGCQE